MLSCLLLAVTTFTRPLDRVNTLDPALSQSAYDARAIALVYESPLAVDYAARPYRLTAGCCELPEISADGLVYTLRVRRLTAQAVVRALERLRDPSVVSPNAWIMSGVESVRAIDGRTVEIRLRRRIDYFSWLLAMPATGVVGEDGEGSGPFRLTHWRKNHEMVFDRRVSAPGRFDRVRYLVVDDASTQWLMFLRGEVDFLGEIARDNWESVVGGDGRLNSLLAAEGIELHSLCALEVAYVGINMRDPLLGTNRKLRQALNAAFDYPAWERFCNGRTLPCDGPVPLGVAGRLEAPFPYASNLALAKRLVAEAGYPGGIDQKTGRRLTLTLSIGRASQESREAGELMAAFYERVGLRLELKFMTWDSFLRAVNEGRVQLYRMGWVGDYPDAQNFLQLFHSANVCPGVNHSNYVNAEYDEAYGRGDWARCQEIVREDCPWVFVNFARSFSLARPSVENYIPSDFPYGGEAHYRVGAMK